MKLAWMPWPQSWCDAMDMNLPQSKSMIERAFGVERVVLERASMNSKSRLEPIVNPASWARQAVKDQACQNRADTKAIAGTPGQAGC